MLRLNSARLSSKLVSVFSNGLPARIFLSVSIAASVLALVSTAIAQTENAAKPEKRRAQIDPKNAIRVNYANPPWNKNSGTIDTGSIMMREGATGRLVQLHLVETGPDTEMFSGNFSINWQNFDKLHVEFYVPPQDLLESSKGIQQISQMIAAKQIKLNPFILRRTPTGQQTVEIFDSRQAAQLALTNYQAQQQQLQGLQNQKFPTDQAVDTAIIAQKVEAEKTAMAADAERVSLEQAENQRLAEMRAKEAAETEAQRAEAKRQAEALATSGLTAYQAGKFAEASDQFEKAVSLDPDNHSYYFQYGVALYKSDNFNKSLVYLNLADTPSINPVERSFFVGLNYFRLKEYQSALVNFEQVAKSNDTEMAPAAEFYIGVIHFELKKWEDAKNAFQKVLDTTKDPQLDKRSEQYVEQVLRIQQFERERAKTWQLSATLGEQYDSNVNLNSNSSLSQGAVSNYDGDRSLFIGQARYRPIYEEDHEFAAQFDVLTMYTTDSSFKYNQTLRNADPTVLTLQTPYTHKGYAMGKGYKFDLSPGFESINMSIEDNTQKQILYSFFLNAQNLFIMNENLYSNFNLELRHDQNTLASENGANDSTAYKLRLVNSNLHFISADKTKIITSEIDYTINTANGINESYDRLDLAVGYLQPLGWSTTGQAKLAYYYLDYGQMAPLRADNDLTLTLGGSKKMSDIYSTGLVGTYTRNSSNTDAYTYNKFTVMLTMSALYAF